MTSELVIRVVVSGEVTAEQVRAAIARTTDDEPEIVESHGIDGGALTALVVLANATIVTLPGILREIRLLLADRAGQAAGPGQISSIRISGDGGIIIDNPRPDDVDRLIDGWTGNSGTTAP